MHEFSLLADLLRKIETIRAENDGGQVTGVHVWIGALAHISPAHFSEHFEHAVQNTDLARARLEVELSTDESDPNAQQIVLKSLEVES